MSIEFSDKVSVLGFTLGMEYKDVILKLEALGSPYSKDMGQISGDITFKIQNPIQDFGILKYLLAV